MPVEVANESEIAVDEAELAGICRFVLGEMQVNPMAELSVLCVDVEYMSSLHERWMGEKGPTDVLAFPMDELDTARPDDPEPGPALLGDVVLCPAVAVRQARAAGHSMDDELVLLATHGVLHLLGYDHMDPAEEKEGPEPSGVYDFRTLDFGTALTECPQAGIQRSSPRPLDRRNIVLGQMVKFGHLPATKLDALKKRPLRIDFERQTEAPGRAPHFAQQLRKWLIGWADDND